MEQEPEQEVSIAIEKPHLLIVEGRDEERLFKKLLRDLDLTQIQVLPIGGKKLLRKKLISLVGNTDFPSVTSIGILRDGDDDSASAFQSVHDALRDNGLAAPGKPMEATAGPPAITVMILPGEDRTGMLETLLLESVKAEPAMECVNKFMSCLQEKKVPDPKGLDKARAHAFLASREKPDKRVGEAAEAGYWNLDSPALDPLKSFLKLIAGNRP
jgi:hypothetical protein